jgi:hypothetical protein
MLKIITYDKTNNINIMKLEYEEENNYALPPPSGCMINPFTVHPIPPYSIKHTIMENIKWVHGTRSSVLVNMRITKDPRIISIREFFDEKHMVPFSGELKGGIQYGSTNDRGQLSGTCNLYSYHMYLGYTTSDFGVDLDSELLKLSNIIKNKEEEFDINIQNIKNKYDKEHNISRLKEFLNIEKEYLRKELKVGELTDNLLNYYLEEYGPDKKNYTNANITIEAYFGIQKYKDHLKVFQTKVSEIMSQNISKDDIENEITETSISSCDNILLTQLFIRLVRINILGKEKLSDTIKEKCRWFIRMIKLNNKEILKRGHQKQFDNHIYKSIEPNVLYQSAKSRINTIEKILQGTSEFDMKASDIFELVNTFPLVIGSSNEPFGCGPDGSEGFLMAPLKLGTDITYFMCNLKDLEKLKILLDEINVHAKYTIITFG